jgi:hypothetical protein
MLMTSSSAWQPGHSTIDMTRTSLADGTPSVQSGQVLTAVVMMCSPHW